MYYYLIMLKKTPFILLGTILFFILSVKALYANVFFFDDFIERNENNWTYKNNGGEINIGDGVMSLSSLSTHFPFVTNSSVNEFNNFENVILEFRFSYENIGYMGNGIGVGYTGSNDYPYYQFSIWNDLDMGPVFQYRNIESLVNGECVYEGTPLQKISLLSYINDTNWHIFKIEKHNEKYIVSIDSEIIFTSGSNQCVPKNIFIGNPLSGGRTDWNTLNIDYVKLHDGESTKNKIIILPGLGASWNPEAILTGSTNPAHQWSMTPFVKNYDLLISGLEANGLVKNTDFYVWNYDWRKPLSQIVADFNVFVDSLNLEADQKFDLVGHSLGGLVARIGLKTIQV